MVNTVYSYSHTRYICFQDSKKRFILFSHSKSSLGSCAYNMKNLWTYAIPLLTRKRPVYGNSWLQILNVAFWNHSDVRCKISTFLWDQTEKKKEAMYNEFSYWLSGFSDLSWQQIKILLILTDLAGLLSLTWFENQTRLG